MRRPAIALIGSLLIASAVHAGGECHLTEVAELTAVDGSPSDQLGFSVALSGDKAIAGAMGDAGSSGSAYIFSLSGGSWIQQAKLTGVVTQAGRFGWSVDIDAGIAIVGAPMVYGPGVGQGAAYVFVHNGAWDLQATLTASDAAPGDEFGYSVAIDGDTVAVGAPFHDTPPGAGQGAAYVFVRNRGVWSEQAKLLPTDDLLADSGTELGYSVGISGSTIVAGAPSADYGPSGNAGAAYVFVCAESVWSQQARLTGVGASMDDRLGQSVAVDGDTIVAGAPGDEIQPGGHEGSATVFVRTGSTWAEQAQFTASDASASAQFGASVAVAGDIALVSTHRAQGTAYLFARSGSSWSQQAELTASDAGGPDGGFGRSVGIDTESAIVGAELHDGHGSAYVFDVDPLPVFPSITGHPLSLLIAAGQVASFSVVATGSGLLSYEWRRNGEPIIDEGGTAGAATATLTIASVEPSDAGRYDVIVTNDCGSVTSLPASLSVSTLTAGDLNGDGVVNSLDLGILLAFWGPVGLFPLADINGDGTINTLDLGILLSHWTL